MALFQHPSPGQSNKERNCYIWTTSWQMDSLQLISSWKILILYPPHICILVFESLSKSRKVVVSIPDENIEFFIDLHNPSSRTMALASTKPLTEMSSKNLPGGKGRPARNADNLTAICEPIV
jgi:hypothetical protein